VYDKIRGKIFTCIEMIQIHCSKKSPLGTAHCIMLKGIIRKLKVTRMVLEIVHASATPQGI